MNELSQTTGDPQNMAAMIERIALSPDVPVERLLALLEMQERLAERENKSAHARAKSKAMGEMPSVPMSGKGHNGRPYSTLKDITSTTRPVLAAHGLALTFDTEVQDQRIIITARLAHASGWEDRVSLPLPFDTSGSKSAVQSIGSSQTYGQRYTAQAILGLAMGDDTDDDGKAAGSGEPITSDQYLALRDLIEAAEADEARLCRFFKIEELHELPRAKYGEADAMLAAKISAKGDAK